MYRCIYFILIILLGSCDNIDCIALSENRKEDYCKIKVDKIDDKRTRNLILYGNSLIDGEYTKCKESGMTLMVVRDLIQTGDTVIKEIGHTSYLILKKDSILVIPWTCKDSLWDDYPNDGTFTAVFEPTGNIYSKIKVFVSYYYKLRDSSKSKSPLE